MDEKKELLKTLEAYRENYVMTYAAGHAMDILIKELKSEIEDED
jgi:hypothetical protein